MFRPHADPGPMLIPIVSGIAFDPREVEETFVRASGPGGQNVNKVSSAVQLKLDLRRPGSLPEALRARVDLKSDRKAGVLRVLAAWLEPGSAAGGTAEALAAELARAASWQGLDAVAVEPRGDLAPALAAAVG